MKPRIIAALLVIGCLAACSNPKASSPANNGVTKGVGAMTGQIEKAEDAAQQLKSRNQALEESLQGQ